MNKLKVACAAALAALPVGAQAAPMIGDTVTCSGNFDCSAGSAVIGTGTEFTLTQGGAAGTFSADFSAGLFTLTYNSTIAFGFGTFVQTFTDLTNPITSAMIVSQSGINPAFSNFNVSVVNNALRINFGSATGLGVSIYQPGATVTVALSSGSTSAVPEPTSWAMLVGGFGLVGGAMRRRGARVSFA